MIEPFINTGKDKLVCCYCGDTVLPGATHYCRDDLKKHAGEVLLPLLKDVSERALNKKTALAIWRAYDQGYLKVPVTQVSDSELLKISNFGPKYLQRFRSLIPKTEEE